MDVTDQQVDIAIVTILPEEYHAVLQGLADSELVRGHERAPNQFSWRVGDIAAGPARTYRVAVAQAGEPTTTSGALAVLATIHRFAPRYVVLVGIAGGFARDGQQHGDVVFANVIYGYEYGKIADGYQPRSQFTYRVDRSLLTAASALLVPGDDWWTRIPSSPPSPKPLVAVRIGEVASGDKVIDDPDDAFFARVLEQWPRILAVEMEGAGGAAAVEHVQTAGVLVGFAMIRGISDMPGVAAGAGTATRDGWKRYAAEAAATFFFELVRRGWPVDPRPTPAAAPPAERAGASELTRLADEIRSLRDAQQAQQAPHLQSAQEQVPVSTERVESQRPNLTAWAAVSRANQRAMALLTTRLAGCLQPVPRRDFERLARVIEEKSTLICGDPGQGKSTTLLKLAERFQALGHATLLLLGDALPSSSAELERNLGIRVSLLELFDGAPAPQPVVVFIDGLDAAFGEQEQTRVVERIIGDALAATVPVRVVATTRTYDVQHKVRWRHLFPGAGIAGHEVEGLGASHFEMRAFDDQELEVALASLPDVLAAIRRSDARARELFSVPFILSIAVETDPTGAGIEGVRNRRAVVERHWHHVQDRREGREEARASLLMDLAALRMTTRSSAPVRLSQLGVGDGVAETLKLDRILVGAQGTAAFAHDIYFDFHLARYLDSAPEEAKALLIHRENGLRYRGALDQWLDGLWRDRPAFWRLRTDVFSDGVPATARAAYVDAAQRNAATDGDLHPLVDEDEP